MNNIQHEVALGNFLAFPPLVNDEKSRYRRARYDRYRLLFVARKTMASEGKRKGLEFHLNYHRTCKCSYLNKKRFVSIMHSLKYGKAFYKGLFYCGSVWTCPVCAAKIQERRRAEISYAMEWAYDQVKEDGFTKAYKCVMVTITFPHYSFQKLKDLFKMHAKALEFLREDGDYKKLKKVINFQALIRSLELTHGSNGWHPHTHEVWIVDRDADVEYLKEQLVYVWQESCYKSGLLTYDSKIDSFLEHSIHVKDFCHTSEYLAKQDDSRNWGIDSEVASSSSKRNPIKTEGEEERTVHPFSFLEHLYHGHSDYRKLWLEYAEAIHGKSQLFFSHGFKKRIGLDDKTDQEISEEETDSATCLTALREEDWFLIREYNAQSEILDLAETEGLKGVLYWLFTHRKGN